MLIKGQACYAVFVLRARSRRPVLAPAGLRGPFGSAFGLEAPRPFAGPASLDDAPALRYALTSMMSVMGRHGRWAWIVAGVALALGVLFYLVSDRTPPAGSAASAQKVSPEELVKLLRENTVRADPKPVRSTRQPGLDQRKSP
jgi:hypothetical protein